MWWVGLPYFLSSAPVVGSRVIKIYSNSKRTHTVHVFHIVHVVVSNMFRYVCIIYMCVCYYNFSFDVECRVSFVADVVHIDIHYRNHYCNNYW